MRTFSISDQQSPRTPVSKENKLTQQEGDVHQYNVNEQRFGTKVRSILTKNAAMLFQATSLLSPTNQIAATKCCSPPARRTFGFSTSPCMDAVKTEKQKLWTFDESCDSMGINSMPTATISVADEPNLEEDTDLIIFGVFAPSERDNIEDDASISEKDGGAKAVEPVLVGKVKDLDEEFSGAIKDLMMDNYEAFKNGAKIGSVTPTLRFVTSGSKTKRFALLGLGEEGKDIDDRHFAKLGEAIASKCDAEKKSQNATLLYHQASSSRKNLSLTYPPNFTPFFMLITDIEMKIRYRKRLKIWNRLQLQLKLESRTLSLLIML